MLTRVYIKNFIITKELDLEIKDGLTTITGDSGVGKSLIMKALSIALGRRASTKEIKQGEDNTDIVLTFDITKYPNVRKILAEKDLQDEDTNELIIRRTLNQQGNSKSYINDRPAKIGTVKEIAEHIIDLHSQHEHHKLMKRENQLDLLDEYANCYEQKVLLKSVCQKIKEKENKKNRILTESKEANDKLKLLKYQFAELEDINVQENEVEELEKELMKMENAAEYQFSINSAINQLFEEENAVIDKISHIEKELPVIEELANVKTLLNDGLIAISETKDELQNALDSVDLDENELKNKQHRLHSIEEIAKRHFVAAEDLWAEKNKIEEEINELDNSDTTIEEITTEIQELKKEYHKIAEQISVKRKQAIKYLTTKACKLIEELRIAENAFDIKLIEEEDFSPNGYESIEFLFRPNKGMPFSSLNNVASGGELSRVSLAIQLVLADVNELGTIVFDEVDVGIGGKIATTVGKMLRNLGLRNQVICITHQAAVAAKGKHHLLVEKENTENDTKQSMIYLDEDGKIKEVARMIGGEEITDAALTSAKEMIINK